MLLNVETCKPLQSSVTTIHLPEITCCCFAFLLQTPGCEKYSTKNKLTYLPRFQMQRMTIKPTICPLWQETGQSSSHLQCTPSTVWSSRASKTQVLHHWLQHHMHFTMVHGHQLARLVIITGITIKPQQEQQYLKNKTFLHFYRSLQNTQPRCHFVINTRHYDS